MTVTSFVPSGKSASTATTFIISGFHQVGQHRDAALARPLQELVADQRDRLGVVQLDAALEAPPRHLGSGPDLNTFLFPYSEMHGPTSP